MHRRGRGRTHMNLRRDKTYASEATHIAAHSKREAYQTQPTSSQTSQYYTGDARDSHWYETKDDRQGFGKPRIDSYRAPRSPRLPTRDVTTPPPQEPSSSYLEIAGQDPSRVQDPATSRKLLVLDLNGTLLHRSPQTRFQPGAYEERKRDTYGNFLPRLRPVHPRPFMPAFKEYLFHRDTHAWLDVMVWSSAQPHSVDDMVDKCFGAQKDSLLAVWARDTLGLSDDHYFRNVQTIKDLAKPWSLLSSQTTHSRSPSPHPSIASSSHSSPAPSSPPRPNDDSRHPPGTEVASQNHSALTTLLLDDSPRKAELQPFNHVCIEEYTGERRTKDLDSLQKERDWDAALAARRQLEAHIAETETAAAPAPVEARGEEASAVDAVAPDPSVSPKKRKRKEKKLEKRAALLEQIASGSTMPDVFYDETLLAVIGVLDETKSQANVAAWIRAGGLWGPHRPPVDEKQNDTKTNESLNGNRKRGNEEEARAQSDDSTLSVKKGKSPKRPKKRQRVRETTPDPESNRKGASAATAGNAEVTAPSSSSLLSPLAAPEEQKMWFEHRDVIAYWAGRGRKALEQLDIPVEHGIER